MRREELFFGAWVSASRPCQIVGFSGDDVTCMFGDGVSKVPIGELSPIMIDSASLVSFGFRRAKGDNVWLTTSGEMRLTVGLRMRHGVEICRRCAIGGKITCWNEEVRYMHELQRWWNDKVYFPYDISLDLEYHGRD